MAIKHYKIHDLNQDSSSDEENKKQNQGRRGSGRSPFWINKPIKFHNGWDLRGLIDSDAGDSHRNTRRGSRRGGSSRYLIKSSDSNLCSGSVFGSINGDGQDFSSDLSGSDSDSGSGSGSGSGLKTD